MKKILLGLIIGLILSGGISYAYRIGKPLRITDFNQTGLVTINENFERLFDLTNGRYNLNVVIINPDGTTGTTGDMILYDAGANEYLEICIGGTIWKGVLLQDLP